MTADIVFQITNKCAATLDVSNLFTLRYFFLKNLRLNPSSITPPGSAEKDITQLKWLGGVSIQHFYSNSFSSLNPGITLGSTVRPFYRVFPIDNIE